MENLTQNQTQNLQNTQSTPTPQGNTGQIVQLANQKAPTIDIGRTQEPSVQLPLPSAQMQPARPIENFAQAQLDILNIPQTDAQRFQERGITNLVRETEQLAGESAFRNQQMEQAGVNQLQNQYRQIANRINARQAQLQQEFAEIGRTPMSFAARAGFESNVRAAAESEILALNAQAQAVAGDYEMAVQTAQRAVEAKFAPIRERLEIQRMQLDAIRPLLERDEKKQARELELRLRNEEREYNRQVENEKAVQSLGLTLGQNQAPQSMVQRALQARSVREIMDIPGINNYLMSPLEKIQIAKAQADLSRIRAELNNVSSNSPLPEKVEVTKNIRNLITELKTMRGQGGAVGGSLQKLIPFMKDFIPGTPAANYKATFDQLKDTLALGNIDKLKGAMSDKDIEFLRNTATKLSLSMSERAFNEELNKMARRFDETLVNMGVDVTTLNSYSNMDNRSFLSVPQSSSAISNNDFFR